jgi:hypothetical protein
MDDVGDVAAPDVGFDGFEGGEAIDELPGVAEEAVLEPPTYSEELSEAAEAIPIVAEAPSLEPPAYAMELREEIGDLPPVSEFPAVDVQTDQVTDQDQMATGHGPTLREGQEIEAPERSGSPEIEPWSIPGGAERRG